MGSLGAKSINEAIEEHLGEIMEEGVQVIWQTGKPFYEQAKKEVRLIVAEQKLLILSVKWITPMRLQI